MFCRTLGFKLTSPQSSVEFGYLKRDLRSTQLLFENVLIAFFRSEIDEKIWLSDGNFMNFTRYVTDAENNGSCMKITKEIQAVTVNCRQAMQFVCETVDGSRHVEKIFDSNEQSKLIKKSASYSFSNETHRVSKEIYTSQKFLQVSWLEALEICKFSGMELFVIAHDNEYELLQDNSKGHEIFPPYFHIDVTNLGSYNWYSVGNSDLKANWKTVDELNNKHCTIMSNINDSLTLDQINCNSFRTSFICQKRESTILNNETDYFHKLFSPGKI